MFELSNYLLFTCLFGHSEVFADRDCGQRGVDLVCFTDNPNLVSKNGWKIINVEKSFLESPRLSKFYKHLGFRAVTYKHYLSSVYIDNTVRLKVEPLYIFDRFKKDSFALFRHPARDCVYDEAEAVIEAGYDDAATIRSQMEYYKSFGMPRNHGLHAATFIYRSSAAASRSFFSAWNSQINRWSYRDQLALDPTRWLLEEQVSTISEDLHSNSIFDWPQVYGNRLPRDFDARLYMQINPDVAASTMGAARHYLQFGISEKRKYR